MCLLLLAIQCHPAFDLILASNRDETFSRPAAPAAFWERDPDILSGRDLQGGGTWLGMTRDGKIAVLTNYRDPAARKAHAPSRGQLVANYLTRHAVLSEFTSRLPDEGRPYDDFNLVFGQWPQLYWYSTRGEGVASLGPGVYGLSNHLLDTPWPKVVRGVRRFREALAGNQDPEAEAYFSILEDKKRAPDSRLPRTGVSLDFERILSSIFVHSPGYGTRASTVIRIDKDNRVSFIEKTFGAEAELLSTARHDFTIQ